MPELRQHYFTKEWVIIATERAKRPEDLVVHRPAKIVPPFLETCPFCTGNENKTPPEVMRVPTNGSGPWQVRVIANKFAALSPDAQPTRTIHRSRRSMEALACTMSLSIPRTTPLVLPPCRKPTWPTCCASTSPAMTH